MLGDRIGEDLGQITSMRVLPSTGGVPLVETSFQADGVFLDQHIRDMGTFEASPRPDGSFEGHGQGVLTTDEGEVATWTGNGVGHQVRPGAMAWRGAVYYTTDSQRLAHLNGLCCVFEFDTDETGKVESKLYEWR